MEYLSIPFPSPKLNSLFTFFSACYILSRDFSHLKELTFLAGSTRSNPIFEKNFEPIPNSSRNRKLTNGTRFSILLAFQTFLQTSNEVCGLFCTTKSLSEVSKYRKAFSGFTISGKSRLLITKAKVSLF